MPSNDTPVRIVVIGGGLIGRRHIEHIVDEPRCELAGVVDPAPETKALAQKAGTGHYRDIEEFLKTGHAQAAIVATPNDTHAPIGLRCAEAGLHILVEKPIASKVEDARKLTQAAAKAGVRLLVGHHRRFNPYIEATKQILDDGRLGTVVAVSALWTVLKPDDYFKAAWRRGAGGGPVLINLIHEIDSLRYFFGDVDRIYAESDNAVRGFPVEETAVMTIRFRSGVMATVIISDVAASPYNFESATGENPLYYRAAQDCYRIFGTRATLSFPDMTLWSYPDREKQGWDYPISSDRIGVTRTIPLENQLRHLCDVVQNAASPRCSGEEGLKTLEATLAVREAVRTGAPIVLE